MNNYFLLNEAIQTNDYSSFKENMLHIVAIEKEKEDTFRRHESVWDLKHIIVLYNHSSAWTQEEIALSKFIEQMNPSDDYISCAHGFDHLYPGQLNAFLGIDFSPTAIETERQVTDTESFQASKRYYYAKLPCNGDRDSIRYCLRQLYGKNYTFSPQAIEDMTYWNQKDPALYAKTHELLTDIGKHPFQGRTGRTEVLKNQEGLASKRINREHRITYRLEKNVICIFTCKGHYN
jgi:toxin YoeB